MSSSVWTPSTGFPSPPGLLRGLLAIAALLASPAVAAAASGSVWASRPSEASYSPRAHERHNSTGGAVTVRRSARGSYEVRFAGLAMGGGNVQVTAAGPHGDRCSVAGWSDSGRDLVVGVRCFDRRGRAVDAQFFAHAVSADGTRGPLAYLWADQPARARYRPNAAYAHNSGGGPIEVQRSGPGRYSVSFDRLSVAGGNAQVTAYGTTSAYCKAVGWGASRVSVACFDLAGRPKDTLYTVLFLDRASLGGRTSYVWGSQPHSSAYSGTGSFVRNAAGGATRISREQTGTYSVALEGIEVRGGTVLVTGYGDDAVDCIAGGLASETSRQRVLVHCASPNGAPADGRFSLAYVAPSASRTVIQQGAPTGRSVATQKPRATDQLVLQPGLLKADYSTLLAGRAAWLAQTRELKAVLHANARRTGEVALDSMRWQCQARECKAQTVLQPTADLCRSLASQVGKVRSFGTTGASLSAAELTECNRGLELIQVLAGRSLFTRPQVFLAAGAGTTPPDLEGEPGPTPAMLPVYQGLLESIPEIQRDLGRSAGWDYNLFLDGRDRNKYYYLPREYRIALGEDPGQGLALSFNYLYEEDTGEDVLMTAELSPPTVTGDLKFLKAVVTETLETGGHSLELVPFPIDSAEVQISDVLADYGVNQESVRVDSTPNDVRDPIRLSLRMSEEAQQNLLSQLRTRFGVAGEVLLTAGEVVARVPMTLSLAEFSGQAVSDWSSAKAAAAIENRSPFPVEVRGLVGYVKSGNRVQRVPDTFDRPITLDPESRYEMPALEWVFKDQNLIHAWLEYDMDQECESCLDAIEAHATTQAGLTRREDLVLEALPGVFADLGVQKLVVEIESAFFSTDATPQVKTFSLYADQARTTVRLLLERTAGTDSEKARYRFKPITGERSCEFSEWTATSSLDITLTPFDVRAVPGCVGES